MQANRKQKGNKMCKCMSAIVLREPRSKCGFSVIYSHATNSHSDLIAANKLRDDGKMRFARVEFVPLCDHRIEQIDKWMFKLDEYRRPHWFDFSIEKGVIKHLSDLAKSILAKDGDFLLGGKWIVPKGVTVLVGPNTVVEFNYGTITENHSGGTITENHSGGTITKNCGTITKNYGTITENYPFGTITENCGTITKNHSGGTITKNYGTIKS